MNNWLQLNYEKLKGICKKITKDNDVDELLHFCIEQAYANKKFNLIENDNERTYFFTKIILNNFKSKSSPYYTTYKKHRLETIDDYEPVDTEPYKEDIIDLEWVKNEIKWFKKDDWYLSRLFELYIEEGCSLTKLHLRTTIPIVSLSRDIKKVREHLIKQRKKIKEQ